MLYAETSSFADREQDEQRQAWSHREAAQEAGVKLYPHVQLGKECGVSALNAEPLLLLPLLLSLGEPVQDLAAQKQQSPVHLGGSVFVAAAHQGSRELSAAGVASLPVVVEVVVQQAPPLSQWQVAPP